MKRTKMRTALAAAAALCAFCSQADVHWTNTDGSSVRYWDDTDNWDNYSAGGNWVFHRDYLSGTPVEVNFRNANPISNGIWIENNLDGLVTFKASSLDCGFENTANGVNVGTGAYGALTIDGGTYYVHNDVAVPSANNGKGVFTLDSGIVRTYYWLPIARNSGSEGTVNINGGEMVVGYRNGAEVDNGVIEIATGANSVGTLVQRGGKMRSQSAGNNPAMKLGEGGSSKASYIISNGVYNATGPIRFISAADSESLFRVAGGEVQVHEGGFEINGASGATGTVDVAGGTLAVTNRAAGGYFDVGSNEGMTGIIDVGEGGTLAAAFIHLCCNKNTTCEMNVDGGSVSMTGHRHTTQDQHIRVGGAWDQNKDVAGSEAKYTQTAGTVEVQDFLVADGLNSTGMATVSGGSLTVDSDFNVASRAGAKGSFTLSGGTLTLANFHLGVGGTSCGEFVQTGGSISIPNGNNWATVGHSGSGTSSYTMTGGTFDMNANGNNGALVVGRNDTTVGTLSVSGAGSLSTRRIILGEQSGASGTVNLGAGGTIAAKYFTCPAGTGIVNWNGGTLKALDSNSAFIPSRISLSVGSNGAVLDANGKTITIAATFPGGASAPLVLKSATGAVTLSEVTSGENLYVNFSVPEDFPEGTYDVPSITVTSGNEIEYATTTLDGKFDLTWDKTANTVTISATETNTAVRKTLASDWTIQDSDETDLSATAFAMGAYVIDLNGHDLTLGSWSAASGALITNSSDTPATLILATAAGQASGNGSVRFSGNMAVKVCGSNTTTFNPELTNIHTGGWIFENNDYNVQIKYHTDQMGTGPVVFNGNGGFTPYYAAAKDGWYEEHVRRNIEVHGEGNVFMSTMNADYNEFLRYAAVTGDGELTVMGTKPAECFSDNNSNFHGKIILGGGDMYVWGAGAYDFTNAVFRMDAPYSGGPGTTRMFARSGVGVYRLGDLCTASAEYNKNLHFANFSAYGGNAAPVWYIGYRNADSVFAAQIFDGNSFVKVGTGTWTLNSYMQNTGSVTVEEGRVDFQNTANASVAWVVNANGTLGGKGTINGTLTVNGTVAPGTNTTETLTVAGTTTFNSGAKLSATIGTDGASSCLALTASDEVSLANLKFQIADVSKLRHNSGYTYTLLTAENGSISGKPRFVSGMRTTYGADGSRWILGVDGTSVKLTETTMGFVVIIL